MLVTHVGDFYFLSIIVDFSKTIRVCILKGKNGTCKKILHRELKETIYMEQYKGFLEDKTKVCLLKKV